MSRFTYFLKMNKDSLNTLSTLGGNVPLNIKNMTAVVNGVADKLGFEMSEYFEQAIESIAEKYQILKTNLEVLCSMKTGYIKDLADGAAKYLNKRVLSFYTDLYKLISSQEETRVGNILRMYAFIDIIKDVINGAIDLTDSIRHVSFKDDDDTDETVELNDTVGQPQVTQSNNNQVPVVPNGAISSEQEPINDGLDKIEGFDDIKNTSTTNVSGTDSAEDEGKTLSEIFE